jgi:predicted nucleic acid-binding protein
MAKVYLETSFFSACVWDRPDPRSLARQDESRRWWVQQRRLHELLISEEVIRELSDARFRNRKDALALTAEAVQLPLTDEVLGLARVLVRERVMPGPAQQGDAMHVAISVVHGIDYLLTWNVRHLANPNKLAHLRTVCLRAGYVVPNLVTPEALWTEEERA